MAAAACCFRWHVSTSALETTKKPACLVKFCVPYCSSSTTAMLNSAAMGAAAAAKQLLSPAWALGAAAGCRSWNSLQTTAGYATGGSSGQGPVTLVFGATGGIGSALARRLHELKSSGSAGAQTPAAIVISAEGDDKLKSLQQQLQGVDAIPADARDPAAVDHVVQEVLKRHGRIDGVVNCVGSVVARSALATDLEELRQTLDVNLVTSFNIVKAAVKGMIKEEGQQQHAGASGTSSSPHRRGGGSIVLVSAALASHGIPNYEAMSAAKAAVEGLARSAAATYSQHNIRVNCVAPGLTRTPQTKKFTENQKVAGASQEMHPLKELAEPEQVAAALEFFLRPENDFITGQVLAVDGGLSTLHPHRAQEYGV